jgi:D-amino-acid dehydrogenase
VHAFRDENGGNLSELGYQIRRDAGAEIERLNADELRELEPALSTDFRAAIVIKGQTRSLSPGRMGAALAAKFLRQGGEIHRNEVKAIRPTEDGAWQVTTDDGTQVAPKIVLAMGAWSAVLLKPLGIRIPLEAERGYHVCFTDPNISLNNSVMDVDRKYVASSMQDGLRVAGTAEFAGLDAKMNEKRLASLVKLAGGLSDGLNREDYRTWSGQRPSLPDSLPCIGEIDGLPNLVAAFGHSHYGLMMAPKTGRLVADLATGTSHNVDLSPYSPTRF